LTWYRDQFRHVETRWVQPLLLRHGFVRNKEEEGAWIREKPDHWWVVGMGVQKSRHGDFANLYGSFGVGYRPLADFLQRYPVGSGAKYSTQVGCALGALGPPPGVIQWRLTPNGNPDVVGEDIQAYLQGYDIPLMEQFSSLDAALALWMKWVAEAENKPPYLSLDCDRLAAATFWVRGDHDHARELMRRRVASLATRPERDTLRERATMFLDYLEALDAIAPTMSEADILTMLESPDARLRSRAAWAIALRGKDGRFAADALYSRLSERNWTVRMVCANALERVQPEKYARHA
jgi:hypothetical protein